VYNFKCPNNQMSNKLKSDIMKTIVKIAGTMLILILTATMSLSAQQGMRGMDNNGMNRMMMGSDTIHRHGMGVRGDSLRMRGMRHESGPWHNGPQGQFMDQRQMYGMGPGMRGHMGPGFRSGMGPFYQEGLGPVGPGTMVLESVPNVTENQKKEIAELLKKHQDDMAKIREEMSAKIQTIRETNRKSLYNILTDEQKKYIDVKQGKSGKTPAGNITTTPSKKK
jgi:hypothetical protein